MALNMEFFEKMPLIQKFLILVIFIVIVGGCWFYFLYTPLTKDLEKAETDYQDKLAKMEELRQKRAKEKELLESIHNLQRDWVNSIVRVGVGWILFSTSANAISEIP